MSNAKELYISSTKVAVGSRPAYAVCDKATGKAVAVCGDKAFAVKVAAVDDLLGACKSALRALKDNLEPGCMDADAIAGLEAAIAKAEGA